jgi:hypothetical protein
MPGPRCPMALGPHTVEIHNTITFPPLTGTEAAKAA